MRLSDFWRLLAEEFGDTYASTLAKGHHLTVLDGRTVHEAIEAGVPPRDVWVAVCDDFDVPVARRMGRDRPVRR